MKNNIFDNNLSEKFFIEGLDFFSKSDYKKAKENFKISVINNPNNIKSLYHLALINTYYDIDQNLAIEQLKKIIELDNTNIDSVFLLAWNFFSLNLSDEGIIFFSKKKILSKQVEFGSAYIFYLLGDFERSIKLLEEIKIEDNSTKRISYLIYYLLGNIYYEQSRLADSLNCFDEALTINPKFAKGYFLRAKIHKLFGNTRLAINDFNKSYEIDKNNLNSLIESILILPHIYEDNNEFNKFRKRYNEGLDYINNIDNYNFHNDLPDNQTFLLSYGNGCNLEILKKKEKIFRKIFSNLNYISPIKETFSSKIRIGFISEFLTDHTIGKLFQGLIRNLDKKKFDIFIFHSSLTKEGNIKKLIDSSAVKSLRLPKNFNDKIFAISNEKLDIIFYPDIGMSSDLYYLIFLRLAKYQINSWGHPETSGNSKIDYFISSKVCEIPEAQKFYSEKLINFNNFTSFYEVPNFYKKDFSLSSSEKYNVYFCSQSLFKILPDFDQILKKILEKDKKAQLIFIRDQWNVWNKILFNRWKKSINKNLDRIKFIDRLSVDDFINLSGNSNVLLDPVYFGSGNSFIETFTYGTPMVTFPSSFLRSRLVMGLYKQLKINDPSVVNSNEDYINLSIELANNRKKNQEIRNQIIENSNKFFFNNYSVINEFENFFTSLMSTNGQNHR
jgi:predicted O-linked N-acetylglucosamine transferase (SPINDLY family)